MLGFLQQYFLNLFIFLLNLSSGLKVTSDLLNSLVCLKVRGEKFEARGYSFSLPLCSNNEDSALNVRMQPLKGKSHCILFVAQSE